VHPAALVSPNSKYVAYMQSFKVGYDRMPARWVFRLASAILLSLVCAQVQAQPSRDRQVGVLLRVETPEGRVVGNLVSTSPDTLVLQSPATAVLFRIPMRNIFRAEEGLGRPPLTKLVIERGLQGAAIGAVTGALAGLYLQSEGGGNLVGFLALVGAQGGALTGGISVLTESRRERWRAIQLPIGAP
jgi:hypothetical protein